MPPESFPRRQVLAAGHLVHATDTYQTACLNRVHPGAVFVRDDCLVTCPSCAGKATLKSERVDFYRGVPSETIARDAVVAAIDAPWLEEFMKPPPGGFRFERSEFGLHDEEKFRESCARDRRERAARDALQKGLLLGRDARALLIASGLPGLLAGAAGD